jgi:uncharacterized protein YndB with AHSA1/START domain
VLRRTLVLEREMPHPPERVSRSSSNWQMRNDFQPVVGHKFTFRCAPMPHWNGVTDCEVLVVEPNRRLSYTWNASGEGGAWAQDRRSEDADPDHRRCAGAHEQSGFLVEEEGNYQGASLGWKRNLGALERVASCLGNA